MGRRLYIMAVALLRGFLTSLVSSLPVIKRASPRNPDHEENYGKMLLKDLMRAIYYHPDLDIARTKLAAARAGVITAVQVPNPTLNVGLTYNSTVVMPTPWTVGTLVNFLLETFGRREIRIAQAEGLAEAARDDLATATWQVRGSVRNALQRFVEFMDRRTTACADRQRLALQDDLVSLLEDRFKTALLAYRSPPRSVLPCAP